MANNGPTDPAATFRELVTTWERNFNSLANQVMGTESFSRLMQEMQRMQLALQHATSEAMGRRLARIEASLEGDATVVHDEAPSRSRPRTRQPPADYLSKEKPR